MLTRLGRLAAVALLGAALAGAGCGSKSKGKSQGTTPGAGQGGSDPLGMGDGDPEGDPGAAGPDGRSPDGDGGVLPDQGDPAGPEAPRRFTAPNLDPDPEQARQGMQAHLRAARDALRGAQPDADRAIQEAKAALTIDGTSVDAVVFLAHAYYHKRLYDTAETILDMLMKERQAAKRHAGVFYVYGLVYDRTGEAAKAELAYRTAVGLRPDYGSALINLGVHQLRNKQYAAAITSYEKLTGQLGYDDAAVWNGLGAAYRGRSADYDPGSRPRGDLLLRAEAAFQRALHVNRSYGPAYYNLGLLYLDAAPFPAPSGGALDDLVRLRKAKTYFEEYKNMPGVDLKLFEARYKDVDKLIKREEKKRAKGGPS
jgi:tetratricopeptide (TPR) repeat protein